MEKIYRFPFSEIDVWFASSRLMKRDVRGVTIRGVRVAVDAAASDARVVAGRLSVSDRTARRRTALKRLGRNFFRQHAGRSRRMARGSCGRQKRVVLAPVAGVKLMEIVEPDRAFDQSLIRQRRRQDEFVSGESAP